MGGSAKHAASCCPPGTAGHGALLSPTPQLTRHPSFGFSDLCHPRVPSETSRQCAAIRRAVAQLRGRANASFLLKAPSAARPCPRTSPHSFCLAPPEPEPHTRPGVHRAGPRPPDVRCTVFAQEGLNAGRRTGIGSVSRAPPGPGRRAPVRLASSTSPSGRKLRPPTLR